MSMLRPVCAMWNLVVLAIAISGCNRYGSDMRIGGIQGRDPNEEIASFLATFRGVNPKTEQQARLALSQWQNNVVDHHPILLAADLVRPSKARPPVISLVACDEDKDLLGIVVEEEEVPPNGVHRSEEYPIFAHLGQLDFVDMRSVTAHVRDNQQHKDEPRWREYVENDTLEEVLLKRNQEYYKDTMPPVYVAIPDPNHMQVHIYVYDRNGHQSDPIELTNHLEEEAGSSI